MQRWTHQSQVQPCVCNQAGKENKKKNNNVIEISADIGEPRANKKGME